MESPEASKCRSPEVPDMTWHDDVTWGDVDFL
jgi:hypothetical protein